MVHGDRTSIQDLRRKPIGKTIKKNIRSIWSWIFHFQVCSSRDTNCQLAPQDVSNPQASVEKNRWCCDARVDGGPFLLAEHESGFSKLGKTQFTNRFESIWQNSPWNSLVMAHRSIQKLLYHTTNAGVCGSHLFTQNIRWCYSFTNGNRRIQSPLVTIVAAMPISDPSWR